MQVSSQEIGKRIKDGKGVYGWKSLRCLKRYFDKYGKCKFILASESGECDEEEYAGIIMSHFCWYEWKPACFFSSQFSGTCLQKWASVLRFLHYFITV